MSTKPLNESLYNALKRAFGEVKISNQGQGFQKKVQRDILHPERKTLSKAEGGEEYQVCCPMCHDKRFRLWFNHRWGTVLDDMRLKHLVVCHNEHCEQEEGFRELIDEKMSLYSRRSTSTTVRAGTIDNRMQVINLPMDSVPVHTLPDDHVAVQYLRRRGFDPQEEGSVWNVLWQTRNPMNAFSNYRLIVPMYDFDENGVLQVYGWQARFLEPDTGNDKPPHGAPKYYTAPGTKKSLHLYNGFRARGAPIVVLCEGPLDAHRIGAESAVAIMGSIPSAQQRAHLWRWWGRLGSIMVIGLDADVWVSDYHEKLEQMEREVRKSWAGVIRLPMSGEEDPGSLPRNEIWRRIHATLAESGIKPPERTKVKF